MQKNNFLFLPDYSQQAQLLLNRLSQHISGAQQKIQFTVGIVELPRIDFQRLTLWDATSSYYVFCTGLTRIQRGEL